MTEEQKIFERTYHAPESHDSKVRHSISLLSKPIQFCQLLNTKVTRNRVAYIDSDDLSYEAPENNIVGDKYEVERAFGVSRVVR